MIGLLAEWIPFIVWLALFIWLLPKLRLFSRAPVSESQWRFIIAIKAIAVPAAILFYTSRPGSLEEMDAGRFFHDAEVVNNCATSHPQSFLKVMFGLQQGDLASPEYRHCLWTTNMWDKGTGAALFYHDNRIVIRLHAFFAFFCAGSFAAHSLFACMLSLAGMVAMFHALKKYFVAHELPLLFCLIFFPSLWLYSGIVSKEAPAVAVMGFTAFFLHRAFEQPRVYFGKPLNVLLLTACLTLSCLLKAYLLIPVAFCLGLLFFVDSIHVRRKSIIYIAALAAAMVVASLLVQIVRGNDLAGIAENRRRDFATSAQGGIFLIAGDTLARVDFDTSLVKRVAGSDSLFSIRANVPYKYWEDSHHDDTLYCIANRDTQTIYSLAYKIRPGHSNIPVERYGENAVQKAVMSLYYSLLHPFFFNAVGVLGWLASFENLVLAICVLYVLRQMFRRQSRQSGLLAPVAFIAIVLIEAVIIGYTTPNAGAISRYRAPAMIFLLITALYFYRGRTLHHSLLR